MKGILQKPRFVNLGPMAGPNTNNPKNTWYFDKSIHSNFVKKPKFGPVAIIFGLRGNCSLYGELLIKTENALHSLLGRKILSDFDTKFCPGPPLVFENGDFFAEPRFSPPPPPCSRKVRERRKNPNKSKAQQWGIPRAQMQS
jgi:hypothetical protein